MSSGYVRSILEVTYGNAEGGKFKVNQDAINQVFGNEQVKNLPVVVISINGLQQTGKTFLLNQFLKYLSFRDDPDWITRSCSKEFQSGDVSATPTSGIHVWTDPFIFEVPDGENGEKRTVGVILMDTQGLSESNLTVELNTKIFALSALLSSKLIFNYNENLSNNLSFLCSYVKYCREMINTEKRPIFQDLSLLVRDWYANEEDPSNSSYTLGYCDDRYKHPGQNFNLNLNIFGENDNCDDGHASVVKSRKNFLDSFLPTSIYAMVFPGGSSCFPKPGKTSESEWSQDFEQTCSEFITSCFSPLRLNSSIKKIGGDAEVTGEIFFKLVTKWGKALEYDQGPKMPASILQSMTNVYFETKVKRALAQYSLEMTSAIKEAPTEQRAAFLRFADENATKKAKLILGFPEDNLGSPEDFNNFQEQLHTELNQAKQSLNLHEIIRRNEKREEEERGVRNAYMDLVRNNLDCAIRELELAKQNLLTIHQHQYEYTTIVEVTKKHRNRMLGIIVSPTYSYHTEARYDSSKYEAAVAAAQRIVSERELQVYKAQEDFAYATRRTNDFEGKL